MWKSNFFLDEDTFEAMKPDLSTILLKLIVWGRTKPHLKFSFGVHKVDVWTPISLPRLSATLMGLECGSRRSECERMTSSDHSHHEAGSNVDVQVIVSARKQSSLCGSQ